MSIEILTDINKINREKWDYFVLNHPNGNIFQTPYYYDVCTQTPSLKPIIVALTENSEIVGILLAIIKREISGIMGIFSSRTLIKGGPLFRTEKKEYLEALISGYEKCVDGKSIYTQIDNLWNRVYIKGDLAELGYYYEDFLNIIFDLTKSKEQLLSNINKKRSGNIRRAIKRGVTFCEKGDVKSLEDAYTVLNEVYKRLELPLAPLSQFRASLRNGGEDIGLRIFSARYSNQIIGTMLALYYKKTLYGWYSGADFRFRDKYPNDFIASEVILWGKKNGLLLFDWGGAGKPNESYGVRDFKLKFGGELVNYGRFIKVHRRFLYSLSKLGIKNWKFFKILLRR